jgi:hypothetical protein
MKNPTTGWTRITARIKVSDVGKQNGYCEWFQDGVYSGGVYNIYMRSIEQGGNYGQPEALWMSYFFGGNFLWASKRTNELAVTNLVASTHGPLSSRYKDVSYGGLGGGTIAELRSGSNVFPSPMLYDESRTSPAGSISSHYEVDLPPMKAEIYTKTITASSPIKIVWDYFRRDAHDAVDGAQDSSVSIYYGAGDTLYASYNYASMPTIGTTYSISSNIVKIKYCMGTNRGAYDSTSKGWKLHYASNSPNVCVVGDSTALTVYTYLVATGLYNVTTIAVEGVGSAYEDASWNNPAVLSSATKLSFDYVIVQNGLNDIVQVDDLSDANVFNYYQTLINDIQRDTKASCKVIASTMTPNRKQIENTWGAGSAKDASAYRRWQALNEAIKGNSGSWYPAITGIDVINPNNTIDLNDTSDNLQTIYQRGGGDYVHPNNYAVQYIEIPNYQELMN